MEETGKPYERVLTDISTGAQKKAEYLAINPMGTRAEGRRGDTGGSRRRLRLRRRHVIPAKLAPPLGDVRRANLYWLFFTPGCVEPAMVQIATKDVEPSPRAGARRSGVRRARCGTR